MAIPLHLVTGFLGSGKTTAVLDLLRRRAGQERIAVLVNDFGAVDIDGATLSSELGGQVKVVDVPGGCICCTAGADLYAGLRRILDEVDPQRVIIEPTGLARPAEIVDLVRNSTLRERLSLQPIVMLVNPRRHFRPPLSKISIVAEQAETADVLVGNFADQARDDDLEQFYSWAGGFYPPKLRVLTTQFGRLPDEALAWPEGRGPAERGLPHLARPAGHNHDHAHDHPDGLTRAAGKEGFLGRAWQWPAEVVFDDAALQAFFARLHGGAVAGVVRAKGVFHTTAGWYKLEVAGSGGEQAGATLERVYSQHRRDSRADIILYRQPPAAFEALDAALAAARVLAEPAAR